MKKPDPVQRPMAYEWMIDLCNRTQRDMWVCVPHFADEEYMYQLASLIREQLDPALKCYVEWSNETWNGMFKQAHYCNEQAKKLELSAATSCTRLSKLAPGRNEASTPFVGPLQGCRIGIPASSLTSRQGHVAGD